MRNNRINNGMVGFSIRGKVRCLVFFGIITKWGMEIHPFANFR